MDKWYTNDFYDYCHAVLWRFKPSIYSLAFVRWFKDPLDLLRTKTNWDVCKYNLWATKGTNHRPFCALRKCTTKEAKMCLFVCLFVENWNPIVGLGFFLISFIWVYLGRAAYLFVSVFVGIGWGFVAKLTKIYFKKSKYLQWKNGKFWSKNVNTCCD